MSAIIYKSQQQRRTTASEEKFHKTLIIKASHHHCFKLELNSRSIPDDRLNQINLL